MQNLPSLLKPARFLARPLSVAALVLTATANWGVADTFVWNGPNGDGGSGAWNVTDLYWTNTTPNPDVVGVAWANANTAAERDTVRFEGAGGTIDVADISGDAARDIYSGNIIFAANGYSLVSTAPGGARIEMNYGTGLSVMSGVTGTIGSGITYVATGGEGINGGGTLNLVGTIQRTETGYIRINDATTINVLTGGLLGGSSNNNIVVGGNGKGGTLIVNGGTVAAGSGGTSTSNRSLAIGSGAGTHTSTITLNSGRIDIANTAGATTAALQFGGTDVTGESTATFNLNGGTLYTREIREAVGTGGNVISTFNFNGGTLESSISSTNFMQGLDNVRVQAGGAIIDTFGKDITIAQSITHDPELGATLDGGLTKQGLGTLTLSGANTYTGGTKVLEGGITATGDGAFGMGDVTISDFASLTLSSFSTSVDFIDDLSRLVLEGESSFMFLDYSGTEIVAGLSVNGINYAPGVYDSAAISGGQVMGNGTITVIPEPGTAVTLLGGLSLLAGMRRLRRR